MFVTFAGSPDRVEARLVPEPATSSTRSAISGFPRSRRRRCCSALYRAGVAPSACRAILRAAPAGRRLRRRRLRRRADGARGARRCGSRRRSPRPTRTSGSRTGSRAPFAKRVFLAYPLDGLDGEKYRVVGRPIPARARRDAEGRGARDLRAAAGRARCCSSRARSRARSSLNELVVEAFGEVGPGDPAHHRASATTSRCGGASSGPTTA